MLDAILTLAALAIGVWLYVRLARRHATMMTVLHAAIDNELTKLHDEVTALRAKVEGKL